MNDEDLKLVTLARGASLRAHVPHTGVAAGAAVRDVDGRTYAGATVENADPSLSTSALRAAVVAAASSGARRFEAAAVVTTGELDEHELGTLTEFGSGVPVYVAGPDGALRETRSS